MVNFQTIEYLFESQTVWLTKSPFSSR